MGWEDGDYKVGFKSLLSASATNSEVSTIKNQTLIYKLSAYLYWQMGSNCSRSLQSIRSREGALNLISLTTQVATFHETPPSLFLGHIVYKAYSDGVE